MNPVEFALSDISDQKTVARSDVSEAKIHIVRAKIN